MVAVKSGDAVTNVVAEDVAYIENDIRKAIFVMRDGKKVVGVRRKGTFEEAVAGVTDKAAFVQTHKSFFVNMKYIRELRQEFAVMDNGTKIPINRKRFSAVKSRYMEYVSEGGQIQ